MSDPRDPTVPRPCPVPTSAMEPREKGDHCRKCDTLVLDTARHTRAEFLAIVAREPKVCAHLRSDGAGRVRFADSSVKRRLSVVALSAALAACGDDAVGVTATPPGTVVEQPQTVGVTTTPPETVIEQAQTIGEIAAPASAPPPPSTAVVDEPVPIVRPTIRRGRVQPPRHDGFDEPVGLVE